MEHEPPVDLRGGVIYHCGPVVAKQRRRLARHGGGADDQHPRGAVSGRHHRQIRRPRGDRQGRHGRARRWPALKEHGAVYLNAIGGAAQFYARCIERVDGVSLLEFGTPEAMWHLQLEDFPAIVTMDAHGNSLHKDVEQESAERTGRAGGAGLSGRKRSN